MTIGFSIVVPSHGRVQYLERLAQGLQVAKDNFCFPTETIFVDDTPEPEQSQIREIAARYQCRYISGIQSLPVKRNRGIQEAQFDYILFIDSDCEPTPHLLVEHWNSLTSSPDVGGCLGLLTFVGPEHWFWDVIELTPYIQPMYWARYETAVPWGPTANISYRRNVLLLAGGFDETFPPRPGGEDVDIGLRVTKNGFRIVTNPHAEVFHTKDTWIGIYTAFKRFYQWGRADHYLFVRHPDRLLPLFPRTLPLTALVALLSCFLAVLRFPLWILIVPAVWFIATVSLQATLRHILLGRGKKSNIVMQFVSILLTLSGEIGLLQESLKRRDWRPICYGMRYGIDHRKVRIRMWSALVTLLLAIVGILLWR